MPDESPHLRLIAAVIAGECDRAAILDDVPTEAMPGEYGTVWELLRSAESAGHPLGAVGLLDAMPGEPQAVTAESLAAAIGAIDYTTTAGALAERINAMHQRTQAAAVATRLISQAQPGGPDMGTALEEAMTELQAIQSGMTCRDIEHVSEIMPRTLERMDAERRGEDDSISTGYQRLDGYYKPRPGDLVVIAARASIGKTAYAINLAVRGVAHETATGIVSLEMTSEQLTERILQVSSRVPIGRLTQSSASASDWATAKEHVDRLGNDAQIYISSPRDVTLAGVRKRMRDMVRKHCCRVVMVDYMQLITVPGNRESREREVSEISGSLKAMAKELGVTVMAVCQLNRCAEGIKPAVSHLRNSGAIEQDADVVILLHRENREAEAGEMNIAKNRNGATGRIAMAYTLNTTRWDEIDARADDAGAAAVAEQEKRDRGWY